MLAPYFADLFSLRFKQTPNRVRLPERGKSHPQITQITLIQVTQLCPAIS